MNDAMRRASDWLGLRSPSSERSSQSPVKWQGAPPEQKWVALAVWVAVAVVAFAVLSWRVPEADGFGGFLPMYVAGLIGFAGLVVTERQLLRARAAQDPQ